MPKKPLREEEAKQAQENLEEMGEQAGEYTRRLFEESTHAGQAIDTLISAVKADPIKAALVALGVGAVIGLMVNKRA